MQAVKRTGMCARERVCVYVREKEDRFCYGVALFPFGGISVRFPRIFQITPSNLFSELHVLLLSFASLESLRNLFVSCS